MDVATTGNSVTSSSQPNGAIRKPRAASRQASVADTKPNASSTKASSVTANARPSPKPRSGTAGAKPRAANPDSTASTNPKVPGTPKPKPKPEPTKPDAQAPVQPGPAKLGTCHPSQSNPDYRCRWKGDVGGARKCRVSKIFEEDQNKVVAKANEVVGALLTPSRHVVNLLSELGALFPPCKQVSGTLAALIKHEVSRPEKDVRVAIVHFDLARALVHIGGLNRKSRPARSIGEPLNKLLKNFKDEIQGFSQFCEDYYETRAPECWKSDKDSLNSFADRIAQLKKSMISLLSQQAVQHPGKHADVLAQIESRLAKHRTFYASLRDANEETPEVPPSGQLKRGDAPVQPTQDAPLLKQLVDTVEEGVTQGISSAIKKTTVSTLKQVQEHVAKSLPDAKKTRRGVKGFFASAIQDSLVEFITGEPQMDRVDTKSGPPRRPERIQKQAPVTKQAPARGQRAGQQERKRTSETRGKPQTSLVQGQQIVNIVNTNAKPDSRSQRSRNVTGKKGNTAEGFVLAAQLPDDGYGTVEQGLSDNSLNIEDYECADGKPEGDDDYDQQLYYLQGDAIVDGLGIDGEGDQDAYHLSEGGGGDEGVYYDDPGLEFDYGGKSGDGEGGDEPYYGSDGGSGYGGAEDHDYGSGSGGDGEGGHEPYYGSDGGSGYGGAEDHDYGSGSGGDGEGDAPYYGSDGGSGYGGAEDHDYGSGSGGDSEGGHEPYYDSGNDSGDGGAEDHDYGNGSGGGGGGGDEPYYGSGNDSGDGGEEW